MKKHLPRNRENSYCLFPKSTFYIGIFLILSQVNFNILSAQQPTYDSPVYGPFGLTPPHSLLAVFLDFVDFDHDDTLEAFIYFLTPVPSANSNIHYFENAGDNANPVFTPVTSPLTSPFNVPEGPGEPWVNSFIDIDGDNMEELFLFELGVQPLQMKENVGVPGIPNFGGGITSNPFGFIVPLDDNGDPLRNLLTNFVDLDGDNDYDLFIAGTSDTDPKNFYYYENIDTSGNGTAPQFAPPVKNPFGLTTPANLPSNSADRFVDIDCDGDFDLYVSNNINLLYYENKGTPFAPDFSSGWETNINSFLVNNGGFIDIGGDGDLDWIGPFINPDSVAFMENISPQPTIVFDINYNGMTVEISNNFSFTPVGPADSMLWDFGDGVVSNEKEPTHTYDSIGTFDICLSVWYQCQRVDSCISYSTGIDDQLNAIISLYPNPTNDYIFVKLESANPLGKLKMELIDFSGRIIKYIDFPHQRSLVEEKLDISDLGKGIYMLNIRSENRFISSKFIKLD